MVIDINKKKILGIGIILCLLGIVNFYGYDKTMLFLTTFRPPYFITGLTVYDEISQHYYDNKSYSTKKVLCGNAVFASNRGENVLYIHDRSHRFYDGHSVIIDASCPETYTSRLLGIQNDMETFWPDYCTGKYCDQFKRIGEYAYFNEKGEKVTIPAIIAVEDKTRTCESLKKEWSAHMNAKQKRAEEEHKKIAEESKKFFESLPKNNPFITQLITDKKKKERNN